jgi:hypothetical protein
MKKKYRYQKYAYDMDTVKSGDIIPIMCDHSTCNRFLVAKLLDPHIGICYVPVYKSNFDMRNQSWKCFQHRIDEATKRDNKIKKILK